MKQLLTVSFFAVCIAAITTGCYKQTEYKPSMSAQIDSIAFSAVQPNVTATVATANGKQVLTMTGTTTVLTPGTSFRPSIKLVVPTAIGTHTIGNDASAWVYTSATGTDGSAAVTGQIVVLNNASNKVQGNFTFTAADGTVVTKGQYTTNIK